ncbi:MAG: polyphenol oxidase family protein, partial [Pseudomonadales bacterium]
MVLPVHGLELLCPVWPAPARVIAGVTTRVGGASEAPYDAFNLALHVDDAENSVRANRQQLADFCQHELAKKTSFSQHWHWLEQTHGTAVRQFTETSGSNQKVIVADGGISCTPGQVCVVLTADCLPLLLCDNSGRCVGAVHVGWRGLVEGVIDNALIAMRNAVTGTLKETAPLDFRNIYAWLGPAIGPKYFIVGDDVRDRALHYFDDGKGSGINLRSSASEAFKAIQPASSQAKASASANT